MSKHIEPPQEYPRFFTGAELRVVDGPNGKPRIAGYAAVFNTRSADLGGFREEIAPGAFADTLRGGGEVLALVEHDPKLCLGRRSAGTLSLREDDRGLFVEIDPPDTTVGRDAIENIRRKDIQGMSFRFPRGAKDTWRVENGETVRTLQKCGLLEVTLTTIPAYPDTTVGLRSLLGINDDELRSYYTAQIQSVAPKPEPLKTPKLNLAQRRLAIEGGTRATIQVNDDSLIYTCRAAIECSRRSFDQFQYVLDSVSRVTGALTEQDKVAIDDCVSAVIDLQAKAKACRMALERLGASDADAA